MSSIAQRMKLFLFQNELVFTDMFAMVHSRTVSHWPLYSKAFTIQYTAVVKFKKHTVFHKQIVLKIF